MISISWDILVRGVIFDGDTPLCLRELPEFQQLLAALDGGQSPVAVSGLAAVHRAHFAACLGQESGRPVVMVCADEGEAERMARDLSFLTGGEVPVLAARSFLFHNIATWSPDSGSTGVSASSTV